MITSRYKHEFKSGPLFAEIIDAIGNIAPIMTEDAITFVQFLNSNETKNNDESVISAMQILIYILDIFYAFNIQVNFKSLNNKRIFLNFSKII